MGWSWDLGNVFLGLGCNVFATSQGLREVHGCDGFLLGLGYSSLYTGCIFVCMSEYRFCLVFTVTIEAQQLGFSQLLKCPWGALVVYRGFKTLSPKP